MPKSRGNYSEQNTKIKKSLAVPGSNAETNQPAATLKVKFVPFFQCFPQRNAGIHSFCTKAQRFLLEARSCEEQSAHIQRDVLRALPEHRGRAGGSWQFSRVSCREGSSRKRFGAKLVARALRPPHRVLHTRQDWPPATEVLQIDLRSFASQIMSAEWHHLRGALRSVRER